MRRLFFLLFFGVLFFAKPANAVQPITQHSDTLQADTTLVDKFLGLFEAADEGDIPEMKRSRKLQVDELLKAILQEPGKLQFSGVATTSLQVPLQADPVWKGVGSFDIFAYVSFGKGALLFFDLEAGGGQGPDALIPNISGLNADAGGGDGQGKNLVVLEAWTEFELFKEIFTVTFGKIDPTNYFDNNLHANDETSQFISGVFVNNAVLPVGVNSPGIRFRTTFVKRFYIQYGHFMTDPSSENIMENHLKILETGVRVFRNTGWEANLRVLGFEHPLANDTRGFGVSYDQLVANHFNVFARYGKNTSELSEWHGIKEAWSGGIGFRQHFFQREFKLGIGYAETWAFDTSSPEKLGEFYLSTQLNKWVFVTPNCQWLKSNQPEIGEHFLVGMRINFSY